MAPQSCAASDKRLERQGDHADLYAPSNHEVSSIEIPVHAAAAAFAAL